MKISDKKEIVLTNFFIFVIFIGALIGNWYLKKVMVFLIAIVPLIILLLIQRKIEGKYNLKTQIQEHWERDTLLNVLITVFALLSRYHWVAIIVAGVLMLLVMWLTFQTYSKEY
jgi:general stress protein CsbA